MVNIRFLLTRLYFLHSRYTILQELSLADISILRYSPRIVSQKRRKSILPPYARDTRSKIRHFNIQHRMKSSVIEEEEEKEEENKEGTSLEEISFVSLFLGERRHTVLFSRVGWVELFPANWGRKIREGYFPGEKKLLQRQRWCGRVQRSRSTVKMHIF